MPRCKCKIRAMVTLTGVHTNSFEGAPKNEDESKIFDGIKEDFITALFAAFSDPDIKILDSHIVETKEKKVKRKKEFAHHVPRYHTHVYKVEGKMVEIDWLNVKMSNAEARDLAIEIVKRGENTNPAIKSDCEYIAVSFKLLE